MIWSLHYFCKDPFLKEGHSHRFQGLGNGCNVGDHHSTHYSCWENCEGLNLYCFLKKHFFFVSVETTHIHWAWICMWCSVAGKPAFRMSVIQSCTLRAPPDDSWASESDLLLLLRHMCPSSCGRQIRLNTYGESKGHQWPSHSHVLQMIGTTLTDSALDS